MVVMQMQVQFQLTPTCSTSPMLMEVMVVLGVMAATDWMASTRDRMPTVALAVTGGMVVMRLQ
jgi:hypothetical protein